MNTNDFLEFAKEVGTPDDMTAEDFFSLYGNIPAMVFQINVGKYRLAITFGVEPEYGTHVIERYKGNVYRLNIGDDESHARFHWKGEWAKQLIEKQLTLFMPIIQQFMVAALTDSISQT